MKSKQSALKQLKQKKPKCAVFPICPGDHATERSHKQRQTAHVRWVCSLLKAHRGLSLHKE